MFGMDDLVNSSNMDEEDNDRIEAEEAKESDDGQELVQAMEAAFSFTTPAGQPKQSCCLTKRS